MFGINSCGAKLQNKHTFRFPFLFFQEYTVQYIFVPSHCLLRGVGGGALLNKTTCAGRGCCAAHEALQLYKQTICIIGRKLTC